VSPNPVLGAALVQFSLASSEQVDVAVFDTAGRRIRGLFSGSIGAGEHELAWDGADGSGHAVAPGVYLVRIAVGGRTSTLRLVRMR
jgi:flagellar hook assembly protein FlgD